MASCSCTMNHAGSCVCATFAPLLYHGAATLRWAAAAAPPPPDPPSQGAALRRIHKKLERRETDIARLRQLLKTKEGGTAAKAVAIGKGERRDFYFQSVQQVHDYCHNLGIDMVSGPRVLRFPAVRPGPVAPTAAPVASRYLTTLPLSRVGMMTWMRCSRVR